MSLHQKNENQPHDDCFETGTLKHLVPGNKGRVLDGRRTPGFIESYDPNSAMFLWRITDFEDKGEVWKYPAESISAFQFEIGSSILNHSEVVKIQNDCQKFEDILIIKANELDYFETEKKILNVKTDIKEWFLKHSDFINVGKGSIDITAKEGSRFLYNDLVSIMQNYNLYDLEMKTAKQYVLNPYSGEWIKGLKIVMAELGLIDFRDKTTRTKDVFKGIGSKEKRRKYVITRLAFIRSFFELAQIDQVQLFRGMTTEEEIIEKTRTLVSATFNPEVAKAFSTINLDENINFSYLIKFKYSIQNLFMTFLETKELNDRYKEQEAVVMYRNKITF